MLRSLLKYFRFFGGAYRCNVCNNPVRYFFPFSKSLQYSAFAAGFQHDFRRMETLNYNNCNCPFCLSSDRERLYLLFLSNYFNNNEGKNFKILDFAPSEAFSKKIRGKNNVHYISADFSKANVDLRLDICDMKELNSSSFDIVICSHILEHVLNPDKGLSEIFRVLKQGGLAIIMVPIFLDVLETVESIDYNSEELRLKYYGQADHVRLFSKRDFVRRLKNANFYVDLIDVTSFDKNDIEKFAISTNSILYVCNKP